MTNPLGLNQYTDRSKYLPTPAEQKLLDVLCNPSSLGKTVVDICAEAGVERKVYYDAMKKEGFAEFRRDMVMDIIKNNISDVLLASVKFGVNNAKNNADRKMLLEMIGLYNNKQDINIKTDNTNISDEELNSKINQLINESNNNK
ncbi:hypothetical protein [Clostridium sp. BNL1100]|uniref:hypothetical protein n=1 Tax=Clostridium sp. BNL1100 TaxID=755731 RepID=UPI00024A7A9B|nr:hypothetical protein [Clostridium sp. BNL1100]AEY66611.1 hypothetical protein Clo1100_2440 [Clostridium sp. BNL1100]